MKIQKNSLTPPPRFPINLKHELEKIEYTYMTQAYEVFGNVRDAAKNIGSHHQLLSGNANNISKKMLSQKGRDCYGNIRGNP